MSDMTKLVIKLNGEIEQSNFDDWKTDLTERLKGVKTDLTTDSDFAAASTHVKTFKKAEKSLKNAKASAIKQAADINQLFDAIDAVASETRKVRLQLERQIKERKANIKQDAIKAAAAKVLAVFESQSTDFQLLDAREFTDLAIYTEAVKGTRGKSGMLKALDSVCHEMEEKINIRAKMVKQNASNLDSLTSGHQIAFQDRAFLLAKTPEQLDAIIDERIAKLDKLSTTEPSRKTDSTAKVSDDEVNESSEAATSKPAIADTSNDLYEITLHLRASEEIVLQTMNEISKSYRDKPGFVEVTLKAADV